MANAQMSFIITYLVIFVGIGILSNLGISDIGVSDDINAPPTLDDEDLTILSSLLFVFEVIIYYLGLQGLTIVGIPAIYSAGIAIIMNALLIYVLARLVRGGG